MSKSGHVPKCCVTCVFNFVIRIFSASETALTAFRSIHLEKLEDGKHDKQVNLLKKWLKNPNEMLTGLLLGNNIVNILASSIATIVTIQFMGTSSKSVAVATIGMTVVILVFGEITPKIIAKNHSLKIAGVVIVIVYWFSFYKAIDQNIDMDIKVHRKTSWNRTGR